MRITIESLEARGYRKYTGEDYVSLTKSYKVGNIRSNVEYEIERRFFFSLDGTLESQVVTRWAWLLAHTPQGRYIGLCATKHCPSVYIGY